MAPQAPTATVEDVPDPDEDDLDDLDDMLVEFSSMGVDPPQTAGPPPVYSPASGMPTAAATAAATTTAASASASASSSQPPPPPATGSSSGAAADKEPTLEEIMADEEFAKELEANMANLFENDNEMQTQLKTFLDQLTAEAAAGNAPSPPPLRTPPPSSPPAAAAAAAGPAPTPSFQSGINETIQRLAQSNQRATEATTSSSSDPSADHFMAAMLRHLQDSAGAPAADDGAGGAAGAGEEDLSRLLLSMMDELTNKDILYEPMRELHDRFPRWMEEHAGRVGPEDMGRYEVQRAIVREIVDRFESKSYSDTNPADREFIVDKMQKMQAAGAPPPDLVGDMSSAQEMLGMEEGCNPQ